VPHGPHCTVCTDGSVHEPVHDHHSERLTSTTERHHAHRARSAQLGRVWLELHQDAGRAELGNLRGTGCDPVRCRYEVSERRMDQQGRPPRRGTAAPGPIVPLCHPWSPIAGNASHKTALIETVAHR
jgi:hypothetical protein